LSFAQKTKSQFSIDNILAYQLAIMNLQGATSGKLSFYTDEMSEAECLESWQKNQSFSPICDYSVLKSMVLYLYEQHVEALTCALEAGKLIDFIANQIGIAEHNFYYSLVLAAK
jgi:predicted ATPase